MVMSFSIGIVFRLGQWQTLGDMNIPDVHDSISPVYNHLDYDPASAVD
jgi:hypothetical protein